MRSQSELQETTIFIAMNTPPEAQFTGVAVIVPAFNESATIRSVLLSLLRLPVPVIVVDDHSEPALYPLISDLPVSYLYHRVNLGQGAALQTGIEYALGKNVSTVVTFDADGQHDAGDITLLIDPILRDEADVVLGSRFLASASNISLPRKMILQMARLVNFLFSGLLLTDAHNGLRAFNREALNKICITENRMAHASEILFEIKRHKLRWMEVPVHIHYSDYSRNKGQSPWESIKILFDLVLHKLFK